MENSLFSCALAFLLLTILTLTSSKPLFNFTTDEQALLLFKSSHGISNDTWPSNTSICYWTGVSCGPKHHRVIALNVSGFRLEGTITPHLGNLTFLRSLDISFNNFRSLVPVELSNLRRLKEINLGVNNFSGEIPAWFGALSQLQYIYLNNNTFSGSIPNGMFNISSLVEIDLGFNMLSGELPSDICNNTTPTLKRIYLSWNQFSGKIPANIYKCKELEDLRLEKNNFTGNIPSSIFNMSSMRIMSFKYNNLSGSISTDTFYNLPQIEELYFTETQLTGGIPKQIGNLTSLRVLDFASNQLTGELPEELGNLANLEVFAVAYNHLSGPIPPRIFNISTLKTLVFQENNFSGSLPSNLGLSLPNLEWFILHFNRLTGEIPSSIANASKLTRLELNRNSLSGLIPNFGALENLRILRLWDNNLTSDQEMTFLSGLTNCRYLEVIEVSDNQLNGILPVSVGNLSSTLVRFLASNCNIKGVIPPQFGNLYKLQALFLSENQLTGFIPTSLGELKQLVELRLGGNQLQGYIPNELCGMSSLGVLDLSVNMLTGEINECLGEVTTLRGLSFSSNKLNSSIPSKFWDLSHLNFLYLSSNYLTGQLSPQIGTWTINELDLSSNQFVGGIPSSIGDCQSLEYLWLSNNMFAGSIPEDLGKVKGLRTLDLSNNSLSGSIPKSLEELRDLEEFSVSYNKLEGEIPNGGCFRTFNATSFVYNSGLCGATRFQVPTCVKKHGRSRSKSIALIVVPTFVATIVLVVVIVMLIRRLNQKKIPPNSVDSLLENFAWRRISYIELTQGTSSFSEINLLGRGSFGSVFKATLSDGLSVAVKVFHVQVERAVKSFDTESEILSSIRHRNLVPVIGCCTNTEFRALILEYMPNGSLEKWLHSDSYYLDFVQRLKIAIDVALALEYLHHGHTFPVVHCDIKPSNILLDQDMIAHVGDFGISKLFEEGETMVQTKTLATIGYAAPEYGSEGKVSTNGDVYSYGILLLEMFTRKKPTDDMFDGETSLKEWVSEALQENVISEIVAPGLLTTEDQYFSEKEHCVSSIFDLAMKCLAFSPDERINMIQVVAALEKIKAKVTTAAEANIRHSRR